MDSGDAPVGVAPVSGPKPDMLEILRARTVAHRAEPPKTRKASAGGRRSRTILDTPELTPDDAENTQEKTPPVRPLPSPSEPPSEVLNHWDGSARFENPTGPVKMTFEEYHGALTAYWKWALRCADRFAPRRAPCPPGRVTWDDVEAYWAQEPRERVWKFVSRRARDVGSCCHTYMVPRCDTCGYEAQEFARRKLRCRTRGCMVCSRDQANGWRHAARLWAESHPIERRKGERSRDYFLHVLTQPKRPYFSVERLREDFGLARKQGQNVWANVARFNPRENGGTLGGQYGVYPGKCEDAGALVSLEVGPRGNVHTNVFRYGAYHESDDIREAASEPVRRSALADLMKIGEAGRRQVWTKDKALYEQKPRPGGCSHRAGRDVGRMVGEAVKYVAKGSAKADEYRREYTHPLLMVLAEMAMRDANQIVTYGSMRHLKAEAAEAQAADDKAEDSEHEEHGPCPKCGGTKWTATTVTRSFAWVPKGYGANRRRGGGAEPRAP